MSEAGILSEDDRVELIEGELIKMSPIGISHAACVNRLNSVLNRRAGDQVIISVQNPIRLDRYSEPEPDLALLKYRDDFYAQEHPAAGDVVLIIEVADTSVEYDRNVKLPLYANANIPEAWLVSIREDVVEAYSQPVDGIYQSIRLINRGESFSPQSLSNLILSIEDILG
jgi:Uma2 family endonuclease